MMTTDRVVFVLRGLLVLAFAAILLLQVMSIPGTLAYNAEQSADPFWHYPLLVVLEVELICVQVVVVATWMLLGMVREDRIFSDAAFRWVDLIIGAIVAAWLVWAGLAVFVFATSDDPGLPLLMGIVLLAGAVLGLLMFVMRALLRQATALRSDMDAVI
ncbi:DUF2975 domain-containing protein [Nocardioides euryhalodurans]|uniref:DUF2975 domain-containing protein n=1 Tax=Nocardioides euryhalodurans TaxID=2518370 RepID=A0A4P7GK48_9ACTN|nr:DUF2975 domain-containing protein [Nocardioides euryhalodurans]QBR92041.1 DUF2975 domain-containing protein [Nocardioides euryhalodurans]